MCGWKSRNFPEHSSRHWNVGKSLSSTSASMCFSFDSVAFRVWTTYHCFMWESDLFLYSNCGYQLHSRFDTSEKLQARPALGPSALRATRAPTGTDPGGKPGERTGYVKQAPWIFCSGQEFASCVNEDLQTNQAGVARCITVKQHKV